MDVSAMLCASALILVLLPIYRAEMVSQCITNNTDAVEFRCPAVDVENYYYIYWFSRNDDYLYYVDDSEERIDATFDARIPVNKERGYESHEITCRYGAEGDDSDQQFYHAIVVVTDAKDPVLPIQPSLTKGEGESLTISWNNPSTKFTSAEEVYYQYRIQVNVTGRSHQATYNYLSEAHKNSSYEAIDLTGLECQRVEVSVSLPGNCKEKTVYGALLITPEQFQENASSVPLYSTNRQWKSVVLSFTPPLLCLDQEASYILSFYDGEEEEWSRAPVEMESGGSVEVILDTDKEPRLKRERNYTLRVTVITEYANISSETTFSTESQMNSPGAITNLRVVGYNKSRVNLSWKNPETDYQIPAYSYTVTVESLGISDRTQAFLPEVDPSFSIDLRGHECETVQIEVGLFGDEQEPQLVNATLLAHTTSFSKEVHVETSLYDDGTVREAEITFTPPRLCVFQRASYILVISGGNRMWSHTKYPVAITDFLQPIEEELETGFSLSTLYTANITVFTNYANISSTADFSFTPHSVVVVADGLDSPESVTSSVVGGAVGGVVCLLLVVLVCGFGTGMIVFYQLRRRKEIKQREVRSSVGRCMVHNPIYGGSGDIYEELPDDVAAAHSLNLNGASAVPATAASLPPPSVPPPRKTETTGAVELSESEKEAIEAKLKDIEGGGDDTRSLASSCPPPGEEAEDCYTVMSPAGTLTILPRNNTNRHSAASLTASWPMAGTL